MLFFVIPGHSHPLFLDVKHEDRQLVKRNKIKNVKIDFFILS